MMSADTTNMMSADTTNMMSADTTNNIEQLAGGPTSQKTTRDYYKDQMMTLFREKKCRFVKNILRNM
jgi:hypothetical protein